MKDHKEEEFVLKNFKKNLRKFDEKFFVDPRIEKEDVEKLSHNLGIMGPVGEKIELEIQKKFLEYLLYRFNKVKRECKEVEELKNTSLLYGPIFSSFVSSLEEVCDGIGDNDGGRIVSVFKEDKSLHITEKVLGKIMKPDLFFGLSLPFMEDGYPIAPLLFAEYGTKDILSDYEGNDHEKHKDYDKMLFFLRVSIRVLLNLIKSRASEEVFRKLKVFGILIGIQNGWILEVSCPDAHLCDSDKKVDPGELRLNRYNICLKKEKVDDLIQKLCFIWKEINELICLFSKIRLWNIIRENCTITASRGTVQKQNPDKCWLEKIEGREIKPSGGGNFRHKRLFLCTLKKGGNTNGLLPGLEHLLHDPKKEFVLKKFIREDPDGIDLYEQESVAFTILSGCEGVVKMLHKDFQKLEIVYEKLEKLKGVNRNNAKKILNGMVDSLLICHGRGLYHCDVKLDNFMLDLSGKVKVIDFDISIFTPNIDNDGYILKGESKVSFRSNGYTNGYKPPEKHYHQKSDVYNLGIVFLEIVSQKRIFHFKGTHHLKLLRLKNHVIKSCEVSDKFWELVNRMIINVSNRLKLTEVKEFLSKMESIFKKERVSDDDPSRKRKREDESSLEDLEHQKEKKKRRIDEKTD